MQRITISIDEALGETFDEMLKARGYQSRSEGVRDLVRDSVERWRDERNTGDQCVASLSFIYDQDTRALAQRLSGWRHDHHDLIVTTCSVPLDHESTLETMMLRGDARSVRALADGIRAERGVRFGALNLIGVDTGDEHDRTGAHHHSGHRHFSPRPG